MCINGDDEKVVPSIKGYDENPPLSTWFNAANAK